MSALVEITGCDDSYWRVHGTGSGAQGIWIAEGQAEGIVDAPVETEWRSSAFQVGGSYKHTKWLYRDVDLGFHVVSEDDPLGVESRFRRAFDYRVDPWDDGAHQARIDWTTDISGTRSLDVLLAESPDLPMERDFETMGYINSNLVLRAGQPFWYEDDEIDFVEVGSGTHNVTLTVSNPTDQPCFHKWVLTVGSYVLPDFSWRGPRGEREPGGEYASRTVEVPEVTTGQGGAVIDLDPMALDDRAANGQNRLGLYNPPGKRLIHFLPPYTPPTDVPVTVTAPAGGARVEVRMPRRWSRPWGLEIEPDGS